LVEATVASVDIDPCADPAAAEDLVRERVVQGTLEIMYRQDPVSFATVPSSDPGSVCLEDDDSSPVSTIEIAELVAGTGRSTFRDWLSRLSQAQRAIFVQRAVLGRTNADTARAINGLARPALWTAEAVSSLFRQALCSLASSLVHSAPAAHA